jgi:hypothetical protein
MTIAIRTSPVTGTPDDLGAFRGEQPQEVRAAVLGHESHEGGRTSVRAEHPGDVDPLASRADLDLESAHDGARHHVRNELRAVDAEVRIRDQHLSLSGGNRCQDRRTLRG